MRLREDRPGLKESLTTGKKVLSDAERRLVQVFKWVLRPRHLLILALLIVTIVGVRHLYSDRRQSSLTIPVPADLERLDPQLRAYLWQKLDWVREKPRHADRHATLGIVYAANGLWKEAKDAFGNAAHLDPNQPLAYMYVAVADQELGSLKEAIGGYRDLTVRFPDFAPGYYRLGDASLRAGEVKEAEFALQRLIALAPQEWRGYAGLGDAKLRKGQYAEAIQELEKAIRMAPEEKIPHHLLGLAYRRVGRTQEAELELGRGLNAEHYPMPDAWGATAAQHMKLLPDLFTMARQYSEAGKPEKAIEILEEAFVYHPEEIGVMNHLATAYNQGGQPKKSRDLLLKVIRKDNQNLSAYVALAECCTALEEYEQAISYASRATDLSTNSVLAYLAKANALLGAERDSEALAALELAFRCDPTNAELQMTMGDVCLQNLDRPKEAIEHYQFAVRLKPELASAHLRIGQLNIEQGNYEEARRSIQVIQRIAPGNPGLAILEERLSQLRTNSNGD